MVRIAICDDNEECVSGIETVADQFFKTHCVECFMQTYQSSENLLYDLRDGIGYDLLLLDIEMPEVDGMDLAKVILDTLPGAKIIFITSHLEYAITAYEFSVFRYIPKTVISEKLPPALEDYYKLYRLERDEFYTVEIKNHVEQLPYREILYILKDGKYAVFYMTGGKQQPVRKTLAQVFKEISREYFYFADRGCIVNLANVAGMDDRSILFVDDQRIAISKTNLSDFKTTMLRFWRKQI